MGFQNFENQRPQEDQSMQRIKQEHFNLGVFLRNAKLAGVGEQELIKIINEAKGKVQILGKNIITQREAQTAQKIHGVLDIQHLPEKTKEPNRLLQRDFDKVQPFIFTQADVRKKAGVKGNRALMKKISEYGDHSEARLMYYEKGLQLKRCPFSADELFKKAQEGTGDFEFRIKTAGKAEDGDKDNLITSDGTIYRVDINHRSKKIIIYVEDMGS